MNRMKWFFNNIEYITGGAFSAAMVILLFLQVVSRYAFRHSISFTEEIAVILFILSVYLGAVGATRRKQHLRIEVVVNLLKPKAKLVLAIIANIVFMITNLFLIYGLIGITANLKKYGMVTPITEIPKWTVYTVLPVAFIAITIRLIEECFNSAKEYKEKRLEG